MRRKKCGEATSLYVNGRNGGVWAVPHVQLLRTRAAATTDTTRVRRTTRPRFTLVLNVDGDVVGVSAYPLKNVLGNKMLHKQATSTVNGLIPASVL